MSEPQSVREAQYAANRLRSRLDDEITETKDTSSVASLIELRDARWALRKAMKAIDAWEDRFRVATKGRLLTKWDLSGEEDRKWMERTNLHHPVTCHTCDHPIVTEADFAKHYVVGDLRYTNLGSCWTKEGDIRDQERKAKEMLD